MTETDEKIALHRDDIHRLTKDIGSNLEKSACTLYPEEGEIRQMKKEKLDKHIAVINKFVKDVIEIGEVLKREANDLNL